MIEAWATELVTDFQTGRKLLRRGPLAPPIRLSWTLRPNPIKKAFNPYYQGELTEVPRNTPVPEDKGMRCGFVGSQNRSVRGEKGGFRFVRIDLQ